MTAPRPDDPRDDAIDRLMREHSRETPPAALDDAIRAAARRAVGAKPRGKPAVAEAREPWRWWMPLAAAATIGAIAIGVIQSLPHDASEPMVVSDAATAARKAASGTPASPSEPMAAPASTQPSEAAPAVAPPAAPAAAAGRAPSSAATVSKPAVVAPAPQRADTRAEQKAAAEAAPAPPAARDTKLAATSKRAESGVAAARTGESSAGFVASPPPIVAAAPAPVPATAPPAVAGAAAPAARSSAETAADAAARQPAPAMAKLEAAPSGSEAMRERTAGAPTAAQGAAARLPEAFVAEIRRLLAANDPDGAARELRAFRQAYADADTRLPSELRPWAAGVPR